MDLLKLLINDLSKKEEKDIFLYLNSLDKTKSNGYLKNIFETYLKHSVYHELRFYKLSKCTSLSVFKKHQQKLKYFILNILRVQFTTKKEDKFAEWRKKLDYGALLRQRGEKFYPASIKFIDKVVEETNSNFASAYTLIAVDEMAFLAPYLTKNNYNEYSYYAQIEKENVFKLNIELEGMTFFSKVVSLHTKSHFIKSEESLEELNNIKKDNLLNFDYKELKNQFLKTNLIIAQLFYNNIIGNYNKYTALLIDFEKAIVKMDDEKLNFNKEIQSYYYYILLQGATLTKNNSLLKNFLPKYKTSISNQDTIDINTKYGVRYLQFNFEQKLINKSITKEGILEFKKSISNVNFEQMQSIKQDIDFSLLKAHCYLKDNDSIYQLATQIYQVDLQNEFAHINSEIARIIALASLFKKRLDSNELINYLIEIKSLANTNYNYFIRKDKKFYSFERTLCTFFKSIDKNYGNGMKKALLVLKEKILQIQSKDELSQISKLNQQYFNFNKWLDDCIQLC